MRTLRQRTTLVVIGGTAALGLALTGCSDSGSGHKSSKSKGGSSQSSTQDSSKGSDSDSGSDATEGPDKGAAGGASATPAGKETKKPGGATPVCTPAETKLTTATADRPVNYQVLTLKNTGSRTCTVLSYPVVSFGPDLDGTAGGREDTKPQAVVTLKPGAAAYAGLNTSPANQADDGSKGHAKTMSVDLIKKAGSDGSTLQFGKPTTIDMGDLFVYEPTVTYWQQDINDALM